MRQVDGVRCAVDVEMKMAGTRRGRKWRRKWGENGGKNSMMQSRIQQNPSIIQASFEHQASRIKNQATLGYLHQHQLFSKEYRCCWCSAERRRGSTGSALAL
jgi:hypothetical protein